ncbi:hypothetical protein TSAR_000514 [Trichomalopsis sarcophagae]|uniref:Uncharacterized protein n=1 Tax=Trichomalopsis sarcophagae TaxID=543379 RepID=A0A232EDB5_9HYME|nr:hypothetical protein TSAR_000514 [Trichomalopsis sarcophagae]
MLLLNHQKEEILNKLKLFDVIHNIRSDKQNFRKQFLTSLMEDAWGDNVLTMVFLW